MMSHSRISENRFIAEKCPFCLEPSDQFDSITSRMGTDSQDGPSCFSLARPIQFIFQKITQNGRLSPNHPAEGANFLSELLSTDSAFGSALIWFCGDHFEPRDKFQMIHSLPKPGPLHQEPLCVVSLDWSLDTYFRYIKSNHAAFWD